MNRRVRILTAAELLAERRAELVALRFVAVFIAAILAIGVVIALPAIFAVAL